MPTRTEVSKMHREFKRWRKVGEALGVSAAIAWRYANEDYTPKREDLRKALDVPYPTLIKQIRGSDGRFS